MDDNPTGGRAMATAPGDKVTIAPNVLVTIVHKTAASVPGVSRLCDRIPGMKQLLGFHTVGPGVEVDIQNDQVSVDVYLIAKREVELLLMGQELQLEITRAIEDIVGMPVRAVNIHIEDVATELAADAHRTAATGA